MRFIPCLVAQPISFGGVVKVYVCDDDDAVMRDEFREEPSDVELAAGHTATLRCRPPRAEPEPRVTWKKDGVPLPPDDERILVDASGSLRVMDARRGDTGRYACVAENIAGQRHSAPARLTVRGDYYRACPLSVYYYIPLTRSF